MMRRYRPAAAAHGGMFDTMNTTPLIDVLLVLLIMFIMTIPLQSHEVPMDLPAPGGIAGVPPVTHALLLNRDGSISYDGKPTSDAALPAQLRTMLADPQALLTLRTDPEARYERFDQLLATVKRAGVTKLAFVGNEALARQ